MIGHIFADVPTGAMAAAAARPLMRSRSSSSARAEENSQDPFADFAGEIKIGLA